MAKMTKKFSVNKATLNKDTMELVEVQKENIIVTDLEDVLSQFDGNVVNISISVDTELGDAE